MKKLKKYGSLFLALSSCFTIGGYFCSTFRHNEPVELFRWIYTITFGLIFFINFLIEHQNNEH